VYVLLGTAFFLSVNTRNKGVWFWFALLTVDMIKQVKIIIYFVLVQIVKKKPGLKNGCNFKVGYFGIKIDKNRIGLAQVSA
jgi:hypothetical protein